MMVHAFKFLCKWGYSLTRNDVMDSDWMECDTFIEWLKEVFIPECQAINGIHILHLDTFIFCNLHTSHVSLAATLLCRENNNLDFSTSSFISFYSH